MRGFRRAYALAGLASLALAAPALADSRNPINAYRVKATAKNLEKLAMAGFDVTEGRRGGMIEVYGTAGQLRKLRTSEGVRARLVKDSKGRTTAARSARRFGRKARAAQALTGSDASYRVWRRYDAVPGDGKEQYVELYGRLAQRSIVKMVDIGDSVLGRDIIALKVTRNAKGTADNSRPAVLYNALQHAREWLAGETCRRTLLYFTDNYGKDPQVTRLVDDRELWFVCVANPDGYEYSFTPGNRLWRKNMANNDGGAFGGVNDGVDPNRNFPVNWGLDDEGSSPQLSSETYRGPGPASEPETQAMMNLWNMVDFEFQKNDHTAAALILYPQGWQQYTPAADDPIFTALAGDDEDPAIPTFDPDLGAELYITNGDTLDTAYNEKGILAYTPEGSLPKDASVSGFEFEDSEAAIQNEFKRHLAFSLDLAESADDPADPDSHLGNTVEDFYVDSFVESYGDPQVVQVLAKRDLGDVDMLFSIAGGPAQRVEELVEWSDGERYYQEAGEYYHRLRGAVSGAQPNQSVTVWFEAEGGETSQPFTYRLTQNTANRVLIMAAEDYTGPTPPQDPSGPKYADEYLAAVPAELGADLYDVDAHGRRAPHPLAILSHYDAVVWYTGDDYLTREPGQVPGTGTSRLALDEVLAARDYINEGGKLVYAGKHAGQQYAEGFEFKNYGFPQPNEAQGAKWCDADFGEAKDHCIAHNDDFLQYYLGSYLRVDNGAAFDATDNSVVPVGGEGTFGPDLTWAFQNQAPDPGAGAPTATFGVISSMIDNPAYQDSLRLAGWQREGPGPFSPFGAQYMAASHDDEAYKRLHRTINVPAEGGSVTFKASYDLEPAWDFLFVEAREVGTEQWTTLPDANNHTSTATGDSCYTDGGWYQLHSRLANYQTVRRDSCTPTGTTGSWNAATGSSNGWQDWRIDLSPYAGKQVEIAIVVATDWAVGNVGAFVDNLVVTAGADSSSTDFESDAAPWTAGPSPEGTPNADPQWFRTPQLFEEGAVVGMNSDSVYAGFEIATMNTADERASFMRQAMEYLGLLGG